MEGKSYMTTAKFGSGKGNSLRMQLQEIEDEVIKIKIHLVRVYKSNEDDTVISLLNLRIDNQDNFYTTVSSPSTSPANPGLYYGYLIRRNDSTKEKTETIKNPDSQYFKKRINLMFEKLTAFDERLPKGFQKGGDNTQGHNGLRIFQQNMPFKVFKTPKGEVSWVRLEGGNRFFHVANYSYQVMGCEGLGLGSLYDKEYSDYGVGQSKLGVADFLNKILEVYEKNVTNRQQSKIEIDIEIENNIQNSIKKGDNIKPETLYREIYPLREKVKPVSIPKPNGIKI